MSLTNYNGGKIFGGTRPIDFVGLKHYMRMFQDPYFWIASKNNLYIVRVSVFGQIPLGFLFAYAIHRRLVRFRDFFQTLIYLPSVISTIVIGILWQAFFSPYGALTEIMRQFINPGWINMIFLNPKLAIGAVLFVILWMYTGLYMIIFLANLQKISPGDHRSGQDRRRIGVSVDPARGAPVAFGRDRHLVDPCDLRLLAQLRPGLCHDRRQSRPPDVSAGDLYV